jgi:hypothetical protein
MRKEGLILFLFLISFASASPLMNIQNQEHQLGETLFAEIQPEQSEEFAKPISPDDIEFFQGRKKIFLEHDILFHNNKHFFYAYLNKDENFTIKIKNILYKDSQGDLKSKTIEKDIKIIKKFTDENNTKTQILSVKPGFIFTSDRAEINLLNKGNFQLNFTYLNEQTTLEPGQSEKISTKPNQTFSYIEISTYYDFKIPVIYIPLGIGNETTQPQEVKLKSEPRYIHVNLAQETEKTEIIKLINFAEENLSITEIRAGENISSIMQINDIEKIGAKSIANLTLDFYSENQGFFQGDIFLNFSYQNKTSFIEIPVYIYAFPENYSLDSEPEAETCFELGGIACLPNELCDGDSFSASDGYCCLGSCEQVAEDDEQDYAWLIGVGIFIILAIIGFFVYRKIKKSKPKKPEQELKEKSEKYKQRITGGLQRT